MKTSHLFAAFSAIIAVIAPELAIAAAQDAATTVAPALGVRLNLRAWIIP